MSWLIANPERRSGDVFRDLQHLFTGRSRLLQIRTFQRGMWKSGRASSPSGASTSTVPTTHALQGVYLELIS